MTKTRFDYTKQEKAYITEHSPTTSALEMATYINTHLAPEGATRTERGVNTKALRMGCKTYVDRAAIALANDPELLNNIKEANYLRWTKRLSYQKISDMMNRKISTVYGWCNRKTYDFKERFKTQLEALERQEQES